MEPNREDCQKVWDFAGRERQRRSSTFMPTPQRAALALLAAMLFFCCGPPPGVDWLATQPGQPPPAPRASALPASPLRQDLAWRDYSQSPDGPAVDAWALPGCSSYSRGLTEVARAVANQRARGEPTPRHFELVARMRAAGVPHVWPRTWALGAPTLDLERAESRFRTWLSRESYLGEARCGMALAGTPGRQQVLVAIAVDAIADLRPLPTRARLGQWLDLEAFLPPESRPLPSDRVVLLGPTGPPRSLATPRRNGALRTRFNLDRPGRWRVQVMMESARGPRPALEAWVFVNVPPEARPRPHPAPGERSTLAHTPSEAREAMLDMINEARRSEGLPALAEDSALQALAQSHAEHMSAARLTAHDVGRGSPAQRARRAGLSARRLGENVVRAPTLRLAHRALWESPSHRGNLLGREYRAVGVGIARSKPSRPPPTSSGGARAAAPLTGPDEELWVCELFADYGPVLTPRSHVR